MKIYHFKVLSVICFLGIMCNTNLSAQEQVIYKDKTATYDYTTQLGTITLENYLPGNSTIIQEAKPLDIVLVLDYTGSMTDATGKNNYYTKVVSTNRKTANSYGVYDNSDNGSYKATGWTVNGKQVYIYHLVDPNASSRSTTYSVNWAYYDDGSTRYYVRPDGEIIKADSNANPTWTTKSPYRTWPTYSDGYGHTLKITPNYSAKSLINCSYATESVASGSAEAYYKMSALRKGVYDFIDQVKKHATDNNLSDRISIVTFQCSGKDDTQSYPDFNKNTAGFSYDSCYVNSSKMGYLSEIYIDNYSESHGELGVGRSNVLKRFVDIRSENADNMLKRAVSENTYTGHTPHDKGLRLAYEMINSYARPSTGTNAAERYILVFSDGKPINDSGSEAYSTFGTRAVQYSKRLKDSGVVVYSVFCPKKTEDDEKSRGLMQRLSSNYPNATTYNNGDIIDTTKNQYYYYAGDNLEEVFKKVTEKIIVEVNKKYGVNTVVADFVNNQYFKLPEGATASDILCYENACTSAPNYPKSSPADTVYKWATDSTLRKDLTVHIGKAASDNVQDTIIVSGYDFTSNWCGWNIASGGSKTIHGNRLLIKIPFTLKNNVSFGELDTNTGESGVYIKPKDSTEYHQDTPYPIPTIPFCKLIISREGLDKGESAIYLIKDSKGAVIDKISLNGTGDQFVTDTLYGAPGTTFTVRETNWNWAYTKEETSDTTQTCDDTYIIKYVFTGAHKSTTDEGDPANLHNHDEAYTRNKFTTLPTVSSVARPDAIEPKRTPFLPCPYLIEE